MLFRVKLAAEVMRFTHMTSRLSMPICGVWGTRFGSSAMTILPVPLVLPVSRECAILGVKALMKLEAYLSTRTPRRNARNPRVTVRTDEAGTTAVVFTQRVWHMVPPCSPCSYSCMHDLGSSLLDSWRNKEAALRRG